MEAQVKQLEDRPYVLLSDGTVLVVLHTVAGPCHNCYQAGENTTGDVYLVSKDFARCVQGIGWSWFSGAANEICDSCLLDDSLGVFPSISAASEYFTEFGFELD